MKKTYTLVFLLMLTIGFAVSLVPRMQAQPAHATLNPDISDLQVPGAFRGPDMFGRPLLRVLEMGPLYVRHTIFLYEDGTIMWRDDFQDFDYDSKGEVPYRRLSDDNERFEDWVLEYGPYRLGKVDAQDVADFLDAVSERGYCDDPGYAFPRPFHTPFSDFALSSGSCAFSISQSFDYLEPGTIQLPGGAVDLNGRSRDEVLRDEHERVRRAYEFHEFFRNSLGALVEKAQENGSDVDIGFLKMHLFPVSE